MGTLVRFGSVRIEVRGREHTPPHFHVIGPGIKALVAIDSVRVLKGSMPSLVWHQVREWAEANRATLVEAWTRHNPIHQL